MVSFPETYIDLPIFSSTTKFLQGTFHGPLMRAGAYGHSCFNKLG